MLVLTDGDVTQAVELVNQGSHNGDIDPQILQLFETQVILNNANNITAYTVDVGVHGQMAVRIRHTTVDSIGILDTNSGAETAKQRTSLRLNHRFGESDAPTGVSHVTQDG